MRQLRHRNFDLMHAHVDALYFHFYYYFYFSAIIFFLYSKLRIFEEEEYGYQSTPLLFLFLINEQAVPRLMTSDIAGETCFILLEFSLINI